MKAARAPNSGRDLAHFLTNDQAILLASGWPARAACGLRALWANVEEVSRERPWSGPVCRRCRRLYPVMVADRA